VQNNSWPKTAKYKKTISIANANLTDFLLLVLLHASSSKKEEEIARTRTKGMHEVV
jgi:hypothetical protein